MEYNAKLTSPSTKDRDTRIVAHPDINPAQQDLNSVIKWEPVFSLEQAVLKKQKSDKITFHFKDIFWDLRFQLLQSH